MKIVFFGTSDVGLPTLELLVKHHEVVGVVTSPDAPVGRKQVLTPSPIATRAMELGLLVYKPEKVKNNPEVLDTLKQLQADIFIVVSYGKILPKELIDSPPLKTLNVHFSLLPKYRGSSPIQTAIKNGETLTGTTIFVLDELMDHGPVLVQLEEKILPDDTFTTLSSRLAEISAKALIALLPKYQAGDITPEEQNHNLATKAPIIKKEDGKVDWNLQAQEIYNLRRAYEVWPGIYTTLPSVASAKEGWNNKLLKILSCSPVILTAQDSRLTSTPGTILPTGIVVCGSNTYLQILALQPEGKQPMDIKAFLNGNQSFIGSVLGK